MITMESTVQQTVADNHEGRILLPQLLDHNSTQSATYVYIRAQHGRQLITPAASPLTGEGTQ